MVTRASRRRDRWRFARAACVAALAIAGLLAAAANRTAAQTAVAGGLEDIWAAGQFLRDGNGDGFIDDWVGAINVGPAASAAQLSAAANIAARAGYETMAMDLPVRSTPVAGGSVIDIGVKRPDNLAMATLSRRTMPAPGNGRIAAELSNDGNLRLVVDGDDDEGLLRASLYLAGRLPYLWSGDGPTVAAAAARLHEQLAGIGISARGVQLSGVALGTTPGISRLLVRVQLPVDPNAARTRLEAMDAAVLELVPDGVATLLLQLETGDTSEVVAIDAPEQASPATAGDGSRPGRAGHETLSLADLYSTAGLLGDRNGDLIPDRLDAVLSPADSNGGAIIDLAARLGLESAGITLPAAKPAADIDDPAKEPTLVLFGDSHPLVRSLVEEHPLLLPQLAPGDGYVRVVEKAFDDKSAVVVTGDAEGLALAGSRLAETLPHLGPRGDDRPTIATVQQDTWRLLSLRSAAGQAAGALYKLGTLLDELPAEASDLELVVAIESPDAGLPQFLQTYAEQRSGRRVELSVEALDVASAKEVFDQHLEVPAETDELLHAIRAEVIPAIEPGDRVHLQARISEPMAVRAALGDQIERLLRDAGAGAVGVTVLPAYKQALGWLEEVVMPRLRGKPIGEIEIRFAESVPPPQWQYQAMNAPTRWLLELFPIDEMLARDLRLNLDQVRFEMAASEAPTYEVIVTGVNGGEILRETFEPALVVQPFFELFPGYEQVRVTTGWLHAEVGPATVIDRRLPTDLERVWDHYQKQVLPGLHDYVMRLHEGKPRADLAPHFGELRIEVDLSEPERLLGIDQEQIAPMEALHEELYFGTLHFFDLFGRMASGAPLNYPGRVIPVVRSHADGSPGKARFRLTGFASPGPRVQLSWRQADGRRVQRRRDLLAVDLDVPKAQAAWFRSGREGIARLDLTLRVDADADERAELVRRTSDRRVDSQWMSSTQVEAAVQNLQQLRRAGLYSSELAYDGLGVIRVYTATNHDVQIDTARWVELPDNGRPAPLPEPLALLAPLTDPSRRRTVQWDTPIPPAEAYGILATMHAEFDAATAYRVGESYLGREIWAMDLMAPLRGSHWSRAKATALKPTVVYSARQHANEVSSTSHVLRLAERLLANADGRDVLERINVVIHPITNADGAQLAYDLYTDNPNHMLHAGYLGALGVDVTAAAGDEDPIYPESNVRERLWRSWLPDIFLNPHGYPSHEWVQPFSEYAGWVRHRVTESRGWWGMRGWFMPGFPYLDDREYPRHKAAALQIREGITRAIGALPEVVDLNRRAYDRYRRYGAAFDPDSFKLDFTDGVLIYTAIKGSKAGGDSYMARNPKVTIWSGSTEAPDETAHGDWLRLVASAGLAWDEAILHYLLDLDHPIERQQTAFRGGFDLSFHRERPGRSLDEEGRRP